MAVLRDETVLAAAPHDSSEDYSAWLLPAVERCLGSAQSRLSDVDVFAAAAGPGSFTGLRVGLTSAKAWSELYNRPVVPVSRLEALASRADGGAPLVAPFVDARREQVFAGLYRRAPQGLEQHSLELIGDEAVLAPSSFLQFVADQSAGAVVAWISLDPACLTQGPAWRQPAARGESIVAAAPLLAPTIGAIAGERALAGKVSDALTLDANYVRRSDAEIFWKGAARHGG